MPQIRDHDRSEFLAGLPQALRELWDNTDAERHRRNRADLSGLISSAGSKDAMLAAIPAVVDIALRGPGLPEDVCADFVSELSVYLAMK